MVTIGGRILYNEFETCIETQICVLNMCMYECLSRLKERKNNLIQFTVRLM